MGLFTDEQLAGVREVFGEILTTLGKDCRLYYPPVQSPAAVPEDPIGPKPASAWRTGGRVPFRDLGTNPLDYGAGTKAVETYDTIKMTLNFEPKKFLRPVPNLDVRLPYSLCETRLFLTDLPKVERCAYALFQVGIQGVAERKYKLYKEGLDLFQIIHGKFVIVTWERE
jgi:hypothetical protein